MHWLSFMSDLRVNCYSRQTMNNINKNCLKKKQSSYNTGRNMKVVLATIHGYRVSKQLYYTFEDERYKPSDIFYLISNETYPKRDNHTCNSKQSIKTSHS